MVPSRNCIDDPCHCDVRYWHKADINQCTAHVRYWHKADITVAALRISPYGDILWRREDVLSAVPVIRKYLIGTHRRFLCWPHKTRLEGGQYA